MRFDPDQRQWVAENRGAGLSGLPATGEPGTYGYDADGNRLPYANYRPDYAEGQVEAVWNRSREMQLAQINSGRLDLPMPGEHQMWVRAMPDSAGADIHLGPGGEPYRLIEWNPESGKSRDGIWDMGHVRDENYSHLRNQYLKGDIDLGTFLTQYHDPGNYDVQDPARNRSHIDEV